MKIAFFDFDGTITSKDSLIDFIRFAVGDIRFLFGFLLLSPILILFKLKIIPNYKAKEIIISYFFKGISSEVFEKIAKKYSLEKINLIVRPLALKRIKWHKKQGNTVVVVSASIESWLEPWCKKNNLLLLSTKLKIENYKITGKLLTKNCYGQEKVNRIHKAFTLEDYTYIYVYGDSRGDLEMLRIANEGFYNVFK